MGWVGGGGGGGANFKARRGPRAVEVYLFYAWSGQRIVLPSSTVARKFLTAAFPVCLAPSVQVCLQCLILSPPPG